MQKTPEYPESFLRRLEVVGSTNIAPENSEKYWIQHRAGITWGTQKALGEVCRPHNIAIFGAGKCNDIRLLELLRGTIDDIDLYDLDADGLQTGISNVKTLIHSVMPEAINFANFNPVVADVTFLMKNLLRKFDSIRSDFQSDLAKVGPQREPLLHEFILHAIHEALAEREILTRKYDVIVSDCILSQILIGLEIQIDRLVKELLDKSKISVGVWEEMEEMVHHLFIKDHLNILMQMTRPGGAIFLASDTVFLKRGKIHKDYLELICRMQIMGEIPAYEKIRDFGEDYHYIVEEIGIPRFKHMDGDLLKMVERYMPGVEVIGKREWEWNRDPHELQENGSVFGAEKVQGIVLKKCR